MTDTIRVWIDDSGKFTFTEIQPERSHNDLVAKLVEADISVLIHPDGSVQPQYSRLTFDSIDDKLLWQWLDAKITIKQIEGDKL